MSLVTARLATSAEIGRALEHYAAWGYSGGVAPADVVLLAERHTEWLGLVRVAREGGVLVLRGMQVQPDARRQGVGTLLLGAVAAWLDDSGSLSAACFGVPYVHLLAFYARADFTECALDEGPAFLTKRVAEYRGRGLDVTLMRRPPRAAVHHTSVPLDAGSLHRSGRSEPGG